MSVIHTLALALLIGSCVAAARFVMREAAAVRASAGKLARALEATHLGIAVWDAEQRLVASNIAMRALYPRIEDRFVTGARYDDLSRAFYDVAPADVVAGRSRAQFVRDSMERWSQRGLSEVVRPHGNRWLLMTDGRTPEGGMVSFRLPFTAQQILDAHLGRRRVVLDELAGMTFDWYWRQDAHGRFVEFSDGMQQLLQFRPEQLLGLTLDGLPGFDTEAAELQRLDAAIAAREPYTNLQFRVVRGDGAVVWIGASGRPLTSEDGEFVGYFGVARDVTDRATMVNALRASEERFRGLTLLATEWYFETDAGLVFRQIRGPQQVGANVESKLAGRSLASLATHPNYELDSDALLRTLQKREAIRRFPFHVLSDVRGGEAYYALSAEPIFEGEHFVGYRGVALDMTEREQLIARLRDSELRFRALTELSSDWYWEMDEELRFTSLRRGTSGGLTIPDQEVLGKRRWDLPGELVQPATWDEHRATLAQRRPFRDLIVRFMAESGEPIFHASSGDPIFDDTGAFRGYRGVGKDITDQVRAQERIERLATVDALTQLPNRQTFDQRAARVLASAYTDGRRCALLFLDLDNFRLLNNGYGHRVGDHILATTAARMRAVVSEPHLLGRRGGDEMVVLLVDVPRPDFAVEIAQKLIKSIAEPARVLGVEVSVTPSIGIAFFPQDGVDLDALLSAADAAMYQAKDSGRKTYAFFTPEVARRVDLRLRLEQRLRKAVEARDFRLFYQPLISLADGKMVGAEALIRWKDVELGEIPPSEFVPIAEESGLIIGLGEWVLREALRARQVWRQLGLDVPPLAINMAGVQLRQLGFVESLLGRLQEYEVAPNEIEIEVTETGLLDTSAIARENLLRLRNAGMKIALDDFGVGFSSLSHLRDLPIHRLKIDRSFTVECMRDARTLTIVKAVIEMARSLGIAVTAEGIETQAQQTWMQHLGCDSAQGFLFSRPVSAEDFLKLFLDKRGIGRERSLMH